MSDYDSSSDSDIDLNEYVNSNKNFKKVYQLQHDKDDLFKFKFMGMFEKLPVVHLGDFNNNDVYYNLTSHFLFEEDLEKDKLDIIRLNITKNGKITYLTLGIDVPDGWSIDGLNKGSCYLKYIDEEKNINDIVKQNLIYPGSTKILYFIVAELKNTKIQAYING